jgi:hypothetical protein
MGIAERPDAIPEKAPTSSNDIRHSLRQNDSGISRDYVQLHDAIKKQKSDQEV